MFSAVNKLLRNVKKFPVVNKVVDGFVSRLTEKTFVDNFFISRNEMIKC